MPFILRSYNHFPRGNNGNSNHEYPRNPDYAAPYEIWQVARATTAAPLYFDPIEISSTTATKPILHKRSSSFNKKKKKKPVRNDKSIATFIDGGWGQTNNPSEEAYHEIITSNETIGTFVSVGTGRRTTDRWKSGLKNRILGLVDEATNPEISHRRVHALSNQEGNGFQYYRFNELNALPDTDFDEWQPRSIGTRTRRKIEDAFRNWALQNDVQADFQNCAAELVRRRRLRTIDTSRWERYALGSCFDCKAKNKVCPAPADKRWYDRQEFQTHLVEAHDASSTNINQTVEQCRTVWAYKPPRVARV